MMFEQSPGHAGRRGSSRDPVTEPSVRTHSATGCCTDVRRGTCDHDHTDVFHVEDSDVWENLSFCPRHVLVNNLQPADGPSVRAKVCSDLRAGSAEVTAKIASS